MVRLVQIIILILILEMFIKKFTYERCDYDSVDENSLAMLKKNQRDKAMVKVRISRTL